MLAEAFPEMSSCFAVNYDSPYLFYPFHEPIGRSLSGVLTLADAQVDGAVRRSLPLESGPARLTDLDRCYNRLPSAAGKRRGVVPLQRTPFSLYQRTAASAFEQARLLLDDMAAEYARGNYALAGGDFNKDLLGDSGAVFGVSGRGLCLGAALPRRAFCPKAFLYTRRATPPPAASPTRPIGPEPRSSSPWTGFLASANVEVLFCETLNEEFSHSDHNPVLLRFRLLENA